MDRDLDKNWQDLCQAAAAEQDPKKLMALIAEIVRALEDRDRKAPSFRRNMRDCGGNTLPIPRAWRVSTQHSGEFHNSSFNDCSE
jgi:hypothetical protein